MKERPIIPGCLGLLLILVLAAGPGFAQNAAVETVGEAGSIDWVEQTLVATGTGIAPAKAVNRAQALAMAQRAAVVVARRNLMEVVKGVHIDSNTRVENFMLQNDVIETRVRGFLRNSRIDDVRVIGDREVEATVSLPMTGDLGQMLLEMAVQADASPAGPGTDLAGRLNALEKRVADLEARLARVGKVRLEQEAAIELFRQLVTAWSRYSTLHPRLAHAAAQAPGVKPSDLTARLARQESEIRSLNGKIDAMARRLASLESGGAMPAVKKPLPPKAMAPYTGLVIDARDIGFRPCLKPQVYGGERLLYPGPNVDSATAVRRGFIRFYRQVTRAQKSSRAGKLPLTVRAVGTHGGSRGLAVAASDAGKLAAFAEAPDSFLARCNVVIVF